MTDVNPKVSVIIPCRNEVAHIDSFLQSLLAQKEPGDGVEFIVADGMSNDGTRTVLDRVIHSDNRVRMVDNPEQFTAHALNHAIRAARGSIIIRMDVHTVYARDYILECVNVLEETGADCVGGPWVAKGEGYMSEAIAAAFQSPFAAGGARGRDVTSEGPGDIAYLGCWHKELFDRLGFFDEELIRNQDDEHNLRIVRAGGVVWQSPRIRSCYRPRSSLKVLFRQHRQYGYWKVRVIQKHRLPASIRHLVPGSFVLGMIGLPLLTIVFRMLTVFSSSRRLKSLSRITWILFIAEAVSYLVASLTASVHTARKSGWEYLPVLPVIFACFHFSYGIGFLEGIRDFLILSKESERMSHLTR